MARFIYSTSSWCPSILEIRILLSSRYGLGTSRMRVYDPFQERMVASAIFSSSVSLKIFNVPRYHILGVMCPVSHHTPLRRTVPPCNSISTKKPKSVLVSTCVYTESKNKKILVNLSSFLSQHIRISSSQLFKKIEKKTTLQLNKKAELNLNLNINKFEH